MFLQLPLLFLLCILRPAPTHAQHTYNITDAFQPGNFQKYHCADTAKVNTWLPSCLHECHIKANKNDGCAYDDLACHCVNYANYTSIIEPCAFPAALHGNGTCTMSDLLTARPIIQSMCNFFNATLYAAYTGCPQELSKAKTLALVARNDTIVRGVSLWNGTVGGWNGTHWAREHHFNETQGYGRVGKWNASVGEGWSWSNGTWRHWNETGRGIWWKR
ncbi:hypothetical protein HBH69_224250 [Parastagonospora nodorum]|nr:hypothetical protein HBH51_096120 [Parastagonospora nodorum]KAH4119065.1 hypothetical protein HBH47_133340 [Parastagonospora nodorum]KAH4601545.1 hypothetical protein HBH82_173840 [Parastagonospora nodorum]KAH4677128.1 hypothetical protein HBH78_152160 [Parastagonospora nodorum]KAH4700975.1 hypothetical protein HBH67_138850 [Parastagonospora nodorum]